MVNFHMLKGIPSLPTSTWPPREQEKAGADPSTRRGTPGRRGPEEAEADRPKKKTKVLTRKSSEGRRSVRLLHGQHASQAAACTEKVLALRGRAELVRLGMKPHLSGGSAPNQRRTYVGSDLRARASPSGLWKWRICPRGNRGHLSGPDGLPSGLTATYGPMVQQRWSSPMGRYTRVWR
ncbi:unnamed protein product, partial [Musa textilis]